MLSTGQRSRRILSLVSSVALLLGAWLGATTPSAAQDKTAIAAARDFNITAALQNDGNYERAAVKWAEFIKKYPGDKRLDRVYYYLGYSQLRNKKYDESAAAFRTLLAKYKTFPKLDGAQFYLGRALYDKAKTTGKPADLKAAADALGAVAKQWPKSNYAHRALFYQGDALVSANDYQAAIEPFTAVITKFPAGPFVARSYYNLGVAQQQLGQNDAAAKTYLAYLSNKEFEKDELRPEIQLRLGIVQFDQKQYGEAEKQFAAAATSKESAFADLALYRQGLCRVETGKLAEAIPLFNALLKRSPNGPYTAGAQLAAGKCYYLTDQLDGASKTLGPLAAGKSAEGAEGCYWLARTLLKLKKSQDAATLLDQAVKTHTEGEFAPYLQLTRINALHDLPERQKETAALYSAFYKKFPEHPLTAQALYMAALSALESKDYAAARTQAEQFLGNQKFAQDGLAPNVIFVAAESHLLALEDKNQPGDAAKAEALYRQLVSKSPAHAKVPRSHLRIALLLDRAKKYDDVVSYLAGIKNTLKDPLHRAEAALLVGRAHNAADRAKDAVPALQEALQAKADWKRADEVLLELAASYRKLDDVQQAAQRLQQLVASYQQSPYRDQAYLLLGEIFRSQEKLDDAINQYNELLRQYPQSAFAGAAHFGLATAYLAKNDDTNAAAALAKLLAGGGDPAIVNRGRYARALVYLRQKKFAEAQTDVQQFLATKPSAEETLDARFTSVLCQIGLKQFDPAQTALNTLLTETPDHPKAAAVCYDLGHALLGADQPDKAAIAFRTLAERSPDSPLVAEAWFRVGSFHEQAATDSEDDKKKTAELVKATQAFTAGLAKAKQPIVKEKLQYKLGDMQFQQAQYSEAAATLQAQIKEYPQGDLIGPARFLAAESLFRADQFEPALPLFTQVAADKVKPYHADALYRAGTRAATLRRWPDSQKHYEALIGQFKEFPQINDARYGLGWALQNQNKLDEATAVYQQVTDASDGEPAAKSRFMIGEIAFERKKYEEAIEHFIAVSAGYPYKEWQAMAEFEKGRCEQLLEQKDKAIGTFKKMIAKFPDHTKAKDAQNLIAELQK